MAKLFYNYRAMSSAKTANLLIAVKNYDHQYNAESRKCRLIPEGNEIYNEVRKLHIEEQVYCVFVDEAQFPSREQICALADIVT